MLLSFVANLILSVGMPLIHPALLSHSIYDGMKAESRNEHFPAVPDESGDKNCSICDFQLNKHLFDLNLPQIRAAYSPFSIILPEGHNLQEKIGPSQIRTRAPPEASRSRNSYPI